MDENILALTGEIRNTYIILVRMHHEKIVVWRPSYPPSTPYEQQLIRE